VVHVSQVKSGSILSLPRSASSSSHVNDNSL
jgi:hypothetical protein